MPIKYLLIDDEPAKRDQLLAHFSNDFSIEFRPPQELSLLMTAVREWVGSQQHSDSIGVLLDWRLRDGPAAQDGDKIPRAATIAQEIRSDATDGTLRSIPIAVVSSVAKLAVGWNADSTAHDLFDAQLLHDNLSDSAYRADAAARLVAFAEGYRALRDVVQVRANRSLSSILKWPAHGTPAIAFDPRIQSDFNEGSGDAVSIADDANDGLSVEPDTLATRPAHEYARFIIRELLETPGPLLDEARVAALLGADADAARSPEWNVLVERFLDGGRYRGPFASGFRRWWTSWIEDWWKTEMHDPRTLRAYDATERVQRLVAGTRIAGIVAAEPIDAGYSRRYTTICEVLQRPLDPVNGIRLRTREPKPWQATRFASELAVKTRQHRDSWRIHPLDIPRARDLQQSE